MTNRLIHETSPYLLQHAHNPVDWYPWGEEALRRAREEDKPILLSIGYSACHWCHVMERECFEDPSIARLMNENFINIKVDREERPDLDAIYMQAVQAMTGHGGWPLTVFLTPDLQPFFGGTYFPPEDRGGMPGFPRVLEAVARAYRTRRGEVLQGAQRVSAALRQGVFSPAPSPEPLRAEVLEEAARALAGRFDTQWGGLDGAPKFPQPMVWEFLLRHHRRTRDRLPLLMVEMTLQGMAQGGIYDHLGGGFHRYSTDALWRVPHFEKMLYDNALLARLYLHAYQATGNPFYLDVVEGTLDYLLREMRDPAGGFYSAQDADSEGEEGKYYLWTPAEIQEVLGKEEGRLFCRLYGVTPEGHLEGRSVLHIATSPAALAREEGMDLRELEEVAEGCRRRLREARSRRVPPARDEKVLTGWNGLALLTLAEASAALEREDYRRAGEECASFLLEALRPGGRLHRSYKGGQVRHPAYLEDYALLGLGLLGLYEATFTRRWLEEARTLAEEMVGLFWEEAEGVFYDTGRDHETLLVRPREVFDNALPCGNSAAAELLLRLAVFTGEASYRERAARLLRSVIGFMGRVPTGFGHWLCALDFYLSTPQEVALVGRWGDEGLQALRRVLFRSFLPNKVVAGRDPGDAEGARGIPLLEGKGVREGRATAYVCRNYACQEPVTRPEDLARQLGLLPPAQEGAPAPEG